MIGSSTTGFISNTKLKSNLQQFREVVAMQSPCTFILFILQKFSSFCSKMSSKCC